MKKEEMFLKAIQVGEIDTCRKMISDHELDIHYRDSSNLMPFLVSATEAGKLEIVRLLLSASLPDNTTTTPAPVSINGSFNLTGHVTPAMVADQAATGTAHPATSTSSSPPPSPPTATPTSSSHPTTSSTSSSSTSSTSPPHSNMAAPAATTTSPSAASASLPATRQRSLPIKALDVNATDKQGRTAIMVAVVNRHLELVSLLLSDPRIDPNCPMNGRRGPLHLACEKGNFPLLELLLGNPRIKVNVKDREEETPLHVAAVYSSGEVVGRLLAHPDIDPNPANEQGQSPCHLACKMANMSALKALVADPRTNPNLPDQDGVFPVFQAFSDLDAFKVLLACPTVDLNVLGRESLTPLMYACQASLTDFLTVLVDNPRVDINHLIRAAQPSTTHVPMAPRIPATSFLPGRIWTAMRSRPRAALPFFACRRGHPGIVKLLLADSRVDFQKPRNDNASPLNCAAAHGHTEIVKLILEKSPMLLNAPDKRGLTPLYVACEAGSVEVVEWLLAQPDVNPDAHPNNSTPLLVACEKRFTEICLRLLGHPKIDPSKADKKGDTPLHVLCRTDDHEVSRKLLAHPGVVPSLNAGDIHGVTPLLRACQNDAIQVLIQLCRDKRIDVNKTAKSGLSPIWYFAYEGHHVLAAILLCSRRNVNVFTKFANNERTPREQAVAKGHTFVGSLLKTYEKDTAVHTMWSKFHRVFDKSQFFYLSCSCSLFLFSSSIPHVCLIFSR